jgi:hypothetical protein
LAGEPAIWPSVAGGSSEPKPVPNTITVEPAAAGFKNEFTE